MQHLRCGGLRLRCETQTIAALIASFFFLSFSSNNIAVIATRAAFGGVKAIAFDDGCAPLFGDGNVVRSDDGVRLLLDRSTGSGFISSDLYQHGFFSANIKLPANYTAGVVVAFYMSNGDVFEKNHDELDIEFLGNVRGKPWRFQTNVYGNGSTGRGREERYTLWFDPSKEFHRYSILWTPSNIIFYVDQVPIREVVHSPTMAGDYPTKPMWLYATIWDASDWATSGGKYKVKYKYGPFAADFSGLALRGCAVNPSILQQTPSLLSSRRLDRRGCSDIVAELEAEDYAAVTPRRRLAMRKFRERYMYYSYCYDSLRYSVPPPECVIVPTEKQRFKETGRLKFGHIGSGHRRNRRRSHNPAEAM